MILQVLQASQKVPFIGILIARKSYSMLFSKLFAYRWKLIVLYPVSLESSSFHKLEKLFDCYQELFVQDPEICLFIQRTLLEDDKLFSPEIGQMLTQTIRFVARILDGGKKTGDFSKELNSNLIAHEIIGILAGASQQLLINHSLSMNELLREAKQMVLARVTQQSKIG